MLVLLSLLGATLFSYVAFPDSCYVRLNTLDCIQWDSVKVINVSDIYISIAADHSCKKLKYVE